MTVCERRGDLFESGAAVLAHGVNCQGVMGAGIAKQFRDRYPDMYKEYKRICNSESLAPGNVHYWNGDDVLVLNMATQDLPGANAKLHWLKSCLKDAETQLLPVGVTKIAMPKICAGLGGLNWLDVRNVLAQSKLLIEVWIP